MKNNFLFFPALLLLACSLLHAEQNAPAPGHCYCISTSREPVFKWTAFKYTDKTGVPGTFDKLNVDVKKAAPTIQELIASGSFTADVSTVNTDNPTRDKTIKNAFFALFKDQTISGDIKKVGKKTLTMALKMNNVTKPVDFKYSMTDQGSFKATAWIDMLDFGLKDAHQSIHKTCEKLHTGKDGVSKTWTDVFLKVTAHINNDCSCS